MKKQFLLISIFFAFAFLFSSSAPVTVEAATPDKSLPVMSYVTLEETEKWILDEVLCDEISEDAVILMEADISYRISDFIEKTSHTYVFFEQEIPGDTRYNAYGYAKTREGSYVYFEISSPTPLSEAMVDLQIAKTFEIPGQDQNGASALAEAPCFNDIWFLFYPIGAGLSKG